MENINIAIIGGGMSGMAAALSLQKNGFKPNVYEQAPELTELGAGLTISPNSTHGLEYLGLKESLSAYADIPSDQAIFHYNTGEILGKRMRGEETRDLYGAYYYQIHRADLQREMSNLLVRNDPNCLFLNHSFVDLKQENKKVEVLFTNNVRKSFDVVIAADGIRSSVRSKIFDEEKPQYTGNIAYRGLVKTDKLSKDTVTPPSGVAIAPKKAFARYLIRKGNLVNFVAFVQRPGWNEEGWNIRVTHDELMSEFGDWHPRISDLIKAAPKENLFKWALYDRDPLDKWTVGNITLLGDAAHPMLPFMGMGAAMGIEDGVIIGRAFREANNINDALKKYENARKDRANFVLLKSRSTRDRFQSDSPEKYDESKVENEESLGLFNYKPHEVQI
ncbi:MAG: FAD-dependent monooxygenase [Pseudomonadota bacterium]|nr:FAD-dependent monooxygenase [Pseudomonadota bacterium]